MEEDIVKMNRQVGVLVVATLVMVGNVRAEEVFAVSDVYGLMIGWNQPTPKILELASGDFGELKQKNGHWDGKTKTIKMYAAKNEEAAVQIFIPETGKAYSGKMSDLKGPGVIKSDRATFNAMVWVRRKTKGYMPDLVIPLDGSVNGIKNFNIPFDVEGLPQPTNSIGSMLFEVWVPKDAKAGMYKGTVSVMKGGKELAKLNVELEVFNFELPGIPTYAFDLITYGMPHEVFDERTYVNPEGGVGEKAQFVSKRAKKITHQVYKLTLDNRCFINAFVYHSQRGRPRYAYPVQGQGAKAKIMSFKEWDDLFGPILDGKVNKYGEPPAHFMLAFNINYPVGCESKPEKHFDFHPYKNTIPEGPGKEPKLKEFEDTWRVIAQQHVDHFVEKKWTKTRFEIYNNQSPRTDRNRSPWRLDEPRKEPDFKGLRYLFNLAHWAFDPGKKKGLKFPTRVDIGHWNCEKFLTPDGKPTKGYKGYKFNSEGGDKYLKAVTDHWVIGVTHSHGAQHLLKEYERPGVRLIIYSTAGTRAGISRHYGEFAGVCYRSARMGIVGRAIYATGLGSGDPNQVPKTCTLFNGKSIGFDGALCTHRLKLWRKSVNHFDYIVAAKKKNKDAAMAVVNKMTKIDQAPVAEYRRRSKSRGFWNTNNVEDFVRAKRQLAAIIAGKKAPKGTEIEGFSKKYNPCGSDDEIVGY